MPDYRVDEITKFFSKETFCCKFHGCYSSWFILEHVIIGLIKQMGFLEICLLCVIDSRDIPCEIGPMRIQ